MHGALSNALAILVRQPFDRLVDCRKRTG